MIKKFGIIGNPISHSLSPILHNYWYEKYNINAEYSIIDVKENELNKVIKKLKNNDLIGVNVTLPFKQKMVQHVDLLVNDAEITGSVNTLYMKDQNDDSEGGNLTTYDFKGNPSFYGKSRVREEKVNLIEEIEYKQNRLVMFLNSPYSIHGVTKRTKTNFYRKYINIIGEFNFELFNYRNFLEK